MNSAAFLYFILYSLVIYQLSRLLLRNIQGPWKNSPPGPPFIPILGSCISLALSGPNVLKYPLLSIQALTKKFGPVTRIALGSNHVVFLSGLAEIKQFSLSEATTWRPNNPTLLEMYSDGRDLGLGIGTGGSRWKQLRRFSARALKDLGAGKKGMDMKVLEEVRIVIDDLNKKLGGRNNKAVLKNVDTYFDLPDLNVIWGLVAGIRYDYDDPRPHRQFEILRAFLQENLAGPITAVPWLKKAPYFKDIYRGIRASMNEFRILLRKIAAEQKSSRNSQNPRGFIDLFLEKSANVARLNEQPQSENFFGEDDLIVTCQDLFIAGSETTSKTLSNFFLRMVLHPEIQSRLQAEIDENVESDRPITMEDKEKLPLCEAAIMEVMRISTAFPITPPRTSRTDIEVGGYRIPAGTQVQMNIYGVLKNERYFDSPDEFRPERFLNEQGKIFVPDAFIPFGYGKRRCLGENLALVNNFIFTTNLLREFNFRCLDEANPPSVLPCGGLTYGPFPFDVRIGLRR